MKTFIMSIITLMLMSGTSFAQEEVKTIQPKIMVMPFVKEGQNIRQVIESDFNKRKAISLIKEDFLKRGYETVDFITKFIAQNTSSQMTRTQQQSIENQIIKNSGCDILVKVEFIVNQGSRGSSVNLILTAQDVYSASNMAEKSPSSPQFQTTDYSKLIKKAMEDPEDGVEAFLVLLNEAFGRIVENGRDINFIISLDRDCPFKFNDDVDDDFNTLKSVITDWAKDVAHKNYSKVGSSSSTELAFNPIRVPIRDETGENYNTDDMIKSLRRKLKKEYNIKTQPGSGALGVLYLSILGYYPD